MGNLTVPVLLALAGLVAFYFGISRGTPLLLIIGAILMSDAFVAYVVLVPAGHLARTLFHR